MKTFKLISLQIVEGAELTDIELEGGLIINKEDEHNTWLIEVYTKKKHLDFFESASQSGKELIVQAVISKRENDPASFQTKVHSVKVLDGEISVLLEGSLKRRRNDYAELLLDDLLKKGMAGEELLKEFKEKMKSKPRLTAAKEV